MDTISNIDVSLDIVDNLVYNVDKAGTDEHNP